MSGSSVSDETIDRAVNALVDGVAAMLDAAIERYGSVTAARNALTLLMLDDVARRRQ